MRPWWSASYVLLPGLLSLLLGVTVTTGAHADGKRRHAIDIRHGSLFGWRDAEINGGLTLVAQDTTASAVDPDATASLDLLTTLHRGPDALVIYVEGSSTPLSGSVAEQVPAANTDAGSALDRDGNGRIQVSEFHYRRRIDDTTALVLGLINPSTSMDTSDVANDETRQFLNATLVNNPTIGFPDYTLGVAYEHAYSATMHFSGIIAGSHGIADNTHTSYSDLADLSANGKGIFAALELHRHTRTLHIAAGAWINSADHARLDTPADTENNYGYYASVDGSQGPIKWNLRLGKANDKVSGAADFQSLALEYPHDALTLGIGASRTGLSSKRGPGLQNEQFSAECYARLALSSSLELSASFQWMKDVDIGDSGMRQGHNLSVYSLRVGYQI